MIIAVDSGGTFCDCVVLDDAGRLLRAKAPSTPPDFEQGVLDAVAAAAARLGLTLPALLAQTVLFAHGTTVATNALITRSGARIALLTTRGHEDAILIARTSQKVAGLSESEIIDVARLAKAEPLVPRSRIHGVDERIDSRGRVVVPLSLERCRPLLDRLRAGGVEAVAVSFLWSFLAPEHERMVRDWLVAGLGPGCPVTISSDLAPVIREYERTSTTVLNAYLTPVVATYLGRMQTRLTALGLRAPVAVMHSSGGVSSVDEASRRAVSLLVSGPAGGALGAQALGAQLGLDRVIATDVGGTSFDVGVIVDGQPGYSEAPVVDKYAVAVPVVDVASIGAGGGSLAWVEAETGVLRVGPKSAGARPGPVCYGAGGTEPTVTDANLVLGRLNPEYFLGGRMRLDVDRAREAIRSRVAERLGMTPEEAAAAIVEIVDAQMADLIRKVTVERGQDPRRFALFAYGGAGGLHAGAYAAALGCRQVVVPAMAAVFSAYGIATSDAKRVAQISDPMRAPFDVKRWATRLDELAAGLTRTMREERLPTETVVLSRFVHLQFRGQVHTVRVPVEPADLEPADASEAGADASEAGADAGATIVGRFIEAYEARYGAGTAYLKAGVEAVALSVEALARLPKPALQTTAAATADVRSAVKLERPVYLHEHRAFVRIPVLDGERLRPGHAIDGPVLVEAEDMTVLVHPGQRLWVDELMNLRIDFMGGLEGPPMPPALRAPAKPGRSATGEGPA